jgi:hypothetical protein
MAWGSGDVWWRLGCWFAIQIEAQSIAREVFIDHYEGNAIMVLVSHTPVSSKVMMFSSLSEDIGDGHLAEFDLSNIYVSEEQTSIMDT